MAKRYIPDTISPQEEARRKEMLDKVVEDMNTLMKKRGYGAVKLSKVLGWSESRVWTYMAGKKAIHSDAFVLLLDKLNGVYVNGRVHAIEDLEIAVTA